MATNPQTVQMLDFVHETTLEDLPAEAVQFAHRCLLDLVGVAAAGRTTELSRIAHDHAARHFGAGELRAYLPFDGRVVSPAGAALAAGMTIDSVDAHDGHKLTKGHTGCHQLPALLAIAAAEELNDSAHFLSSLVVGYEVATRAGIALHATAPDYHTSGAWGAVGCAALGARLLGLSRDMTLEAMGIGEYHGPRSQMMRVIDHPTMLKDGSGWGAMAGVSAAYLAADGFTGAPAITVTDPAVADIWTDLGSRWLITEQYFKPHPVCRWAQPAVEAVLELHRRHRFESADVDSVVVATFHEAARLATALPRTTEQAQYSLPFPVAAAITRQQLGVEEISAAALADPEIQRIAERVELTEDAAHNAAFPANRYARVQIRLRNGEVLVSQDTEPRGDPEHHLTTTEISEKYHQLATPVLGTRRADQIESTIGSLIADGSASSLFAQLFAPVDGDEGAALTTVSP